MKSMNVRVSANATRDIEGHVEYLKGQSATVASRFVAAVAETCDMVAASPGLGAVYETTSGVRVGLRVLLVTGFPNHLLFYRERAGVLEVVRVLHGAQDLDQILTRPTGS